MGKEGWEGGREWVRKEGREGEVEGKRGVTERRKD